MEAGLSQILLTPEPLSVTPEDFNNRKKVPEAVEEGRGGRKLFLEEGPGMGKCWMRRWGLGSEVLWKGLFSSIGTGHVL